MPRKPAWFALCLAAALGACSERSEEVEVLIPGPGLQFHLVQFVRPGYNVTYDSIVICRSRQTASAPREDGVPRGAALVARLDYSDVLWLGGRGGDRLNEAVHSAQKGLHTGSGWMAFHHRRSLRVTADRCRSWVEFVPARHLEPKHVDRSGGLVCEDAPCVQGRLDGSRWLYRDLEIALGAEPSKTRMKFVMESPALVHRAGLDVATDDGGRSWRVTPRAGPAPAAPFEPSPGRYVSERR